MFNFQDLVFSIDVQGDHREKAQIKLDDGVNQLIVGFVTCGKTNKQVNEFEADSEFAVQFADNDQLEKLKTALSEVLDQLKAISTKPAPNP